MTSDIQRDLVFDLGMHHAKDTGFYLAKGFRVVALEANPRMVEDAGRKFAEEVAAGRLVIVGQALWERDGEGISFFVNPVKDDWSSVEKNWAEKGGHESVEISVESLTLPTLFDRHGVPYFIKCDIEGADELFTRQLLIDGRRPPFVSVEANSLDLLSNLRAAGYERFQIVNQALNPVVRPPQPPREGQYAEVRFDGHMSGLFGKELPSGGWTGFEQACEQYLMFKRLKACNDSLAHGWLDFHAAMPGVL